LSKESIGAGMLHESSSLTLRTGGVGNKDGIRSTKAFLTQITPRRGSKALFESNDNTSVIKEPRRIFGADAYLERQKQLANQESSNNSPRNINNSSELQLH